MARKSRQCKIINKVTGEEKIYKNAIEAAKAVNRSYVTVQWWASGRSNNEMYTAEYIDE